MPSRKRNKGKERKAKKQEKESEDWWRSWVIGPPTQHPCNHGCVTIPPSNHHVCRFLNTKYDLMKTFTEEWVEFDGRKVLMIAKKTFDLHPDFWNDAEHRQMAIAIMLRMGTNLSLDDGESDDDMAILRSQWYLANAILILDCYDGKGDLFYAYDVATMKRLRSLPQGFGKRDMLKFYSKRVP